MKVKELIEMLEKCDENKRIRATTWVGDYHCIVAIVDVEDGEVYDDAYLILQHID